MFYKSLYLLIIIIFIACRTEDSSTPNLPKKLSPAVARSDTDLAAIKTFASSAQKSFKRLIPADLKSFIVQYNDKIVNDFKDSLSLNLKETKTETFKLSFTDFLTKKYSFPDPPMFLDFNTDGVIDLAIIPEEFFGPSEGYGFYIKTYGKWTTFFDGAGKIIYASSCDKYVYILYAIDVIANYEPSVYIFIQGSRTDGKISKTSFFVPPVTTVPTNLKITSAFFKSNVTLRMDPSVNPPDPKKEENKELRFIRDNITANYNADSNGYILSSGEKWNFVCMNPSTLNESSLCHGMTSCVWNEEKKRASYSDSEKPWICAWTDVRKANNK